MNQTVAWILFAVSALVFVGCVVLYILQRRALKRQAENPCGPAEDAEGFDIDQSVFDEPEPVQELPPPAVEAEVLYTPPVTAPRLGSFVEPSEIPEPTPVFSEPEVVILEKQGDAIVTHRFPRGQEITCGRAANNRLQLTDPSVSGRHCVFRAQDGKLVLEDLNSSNGTMLGNLRLTEPVYIEAGDRVWVGMTGLYIQSV